RLSALMHENAAQMQRVEVVWLGGEDLAINPLGFVELPVLMMRAGTPDHVGEVAFPGRRLDLRAGHRLDGVACDARNATSPCRHCRRIMHKIIRLLPPRPNVRSAQAGIGTGPMSFGTL